jgi:hypothetical protein
VQLSLLEVCSPTDSSDVLLFWLGVISYRFVGTTPGSEGSNETVTFAEFATRKDCSGIAPVALRASR